MNKNLSIVIIGAGPAGLTAALELLKHNNDFSVKIIEESFDFGGISRTINHNGNRMDIGGHRFFSKSDWVMKWWQDILPLAKSNNEDHINYVPKEDNVLLQRSRLSRIFYMRKYFDYPLSLSVPTIKNMGAIHLSKVAISYFHARIFKIKNEKNLEDFFINRFGKHLYKTFFKSYTEKVWGVDCREISNEWGAQRIKGLSISKAIFHALRKNFTINHDQSISQKKTETSLIDKFLYPKFGPGQMWEKVASEVKSLGGEIILGEKVIGINSHNNKVSQVTTISSENVTTTHNADIVISTMPVKDLINAISPDVPDDILKTANGLTYRDFITVGILTKRISTQEEIRDNWIYIQEPDVKVGRIQFFNNWSPALVANTEYTWLGMEYFCTEGDKLWSLSSEEMKHLAIKELENLGFTNSEDVIDTHVEKIPKAYPAYFGSYSDFHKVRHYTDQIENLYLIGRNGMHKYNNQDHSMLTARAAVDCIVYKKDKKLIWEVNTESDYHESK